MEANESVRQLAVGDLQPKGAPKVRALLLITRLRLLFAVHDPTEGPMLVPLPMGRLKDISFKESWFARRAYLDIRSKEGPRARFVVEGNEDLVLAIARECWSILSTSDDADAPESAAKGD